MATYQGERFVDAQLRSIAEQIRPPDLLVISDDGSSDRTLEVCRTFAADAPFPVSLLDERRSRIDDGPSAVDRINAAFLRGVDAVGAVDFVAFSDQDDVWAPDKLASSLRVLGEEPQASLVFGDATFVDEHDQPLPGRLRNRWPLLPGWNDLDVVHQFRHVLRHPVATGATMVVRSSLLARARPIPRGWLYDRWLSLVGTALTGSRALDRPVMSYRLHHGQAWGLDQRDDRRLSPRLSSAISRPWLLARRRAVLRSTLRALGAPPDVMAETTLRHLFASAVKPA